MSRKLYYGYTSTAMVCGRVAACSGLGATLISRQRQLRTTAPLGSVEQTVKVAGSAAVKRGMHLQTEAGAPGVARWEAGAWTVTIKTGATGGNNKVAWENLFICRADAACGTFTTVASATGFSTALSANATNYSHTITGAAESNGVADDTLYVVLGFRSLSPLDQTVTLEMLATQVQTTIGNPVALSASLSAAASLAASTRRRRLRGASMAGAASLVAGSTRRRRRGAALVGGASLVLVPTVIRAASPLASPLARAARLPGVGGAARSASVGASAVVLAPGSASVARAPGSSAGASAVEGSS